MNVLSPNQITPANAGWRSRFRYRGSRHRPGVAEFYRSAHAPMKRIAQIAPLLVGVLASFLMGCVHQDKAYVEDTDPEMASAIAKAQETLPQFWRAFEQREHGESNFVIVVRITDKGRIEHFFTGDFEHRDGKTIVTITNSPKIVASVKSGDRIEIPQADITDWFYMRDGKYVGLRTMKPRFKNMPPEHVEAFKRVITDP